MIVMLNYNGGTGHLVNLLGFDADEEGITGVRSRGCKKKHACLLRYRQFNEFMQPAPRQDSQSVGV